MTQTDRKATKAARLAEAIVQLCRLEDVSLSRSTLRIKLGSILGAELSHRDMERLITRIEDTVQYVTGSQR